MRGRWWEKGVVVRWFSWCCGGEIGGVDGVIEIFLVGEGVEVWGFFHRFVEVKMRNF